MTHKRVVAVVISVWVLSALLSPIMLWVQADICYVLVSISGFACVLFTKIIYIRIYLVARHHKNQIQTLQVQQVTQSGEMGNFASLIKSAVSTFYVYIIFFICYLPYFINRAVFAISGGNIALKRFHLFSLTLIFFNSSLNPVIYCWKMRHIRHAIMDILRKMF